MRFIKLKEGDLELLEAHIAHSRNAPFRNRCRAIVMSSKGIGVKIIATTFSIRADTVYTWFNSYQKKGISSLRNKPGQGRKPKLSAENLKQVEEAVKKDRQQLKTALSYLQEANLSVCKRTIKRFLKKMATATGDSEGA